MCHVPGDAIDGRFLIVSMVAAIGSAFLVGSTQVCLWNRGAGLYILPNTNKMDVSFIRTALSSSSIFEIS